MADDAGPLLARAGLIENDHLLIARQAQTAHGGTVGEHLVLRGFINDEDLTSFYRTRLMVPRVNPAQLERIPPGVLKRVPVDMAVEFRAVPVAIDREQNLIVAMSDPSNTHAVDEISFFTGTFVVRAVATQREIANALKRHYGFESPLLSAPVPGVARAAAAAAADVQRRNARAPMTSPPDEGQRAFRVSEIVPAIREAKLAEADAMSRGRAGMPAAAGGPPPPAPEPAHQRVTIVAEPPPDNSEADTRPIMRAVDVDIERARRSSEQPKMAAGEVDTGISQDRELSAPLPAVVISDDALETPSAVPAAPISDSQAKTLIASVDDAPAEEPILLQRKTAQVSTPPPPERAPTPPPDEPPPDEVARAGAKTQVQTAVPEPPDESDSDEVVVLSNVKGKRRLRRASATRLGIGELGVHAGQIPGLTTISHEVSDGTPAPIVEEPGSSGPVNKTQQLTAIPEEAPPLEAEAPKSPAPRAKSTSAPPQTRTRARKRTSNRPASEPAAPEPAAPTASAPSKTIQMETVAPRVETAAPQSVPSETELEQTGKFDRSDSTLMASIDDGWGEPGSTIPPPFLGAIEDEVSSPIGIPVPDPEEDDAGMDAPSHEQAASMRDAESSAQRGAAAYDAAVRRLSAAMKRLDAATSRDEVIAELVKYFGGVCKRAAFFAVKRGELHGWRAAGEGVVSQDIDRTPLPLNRPSTFQDVVATRMPFHGPLHDAVSRDFLAGTVGASPTDMTALPITVRDKVVGILYGDERTQIVFDDHLNTLSRSAGAALERILVQRKSRPAKS